MQLRLTVAICTFRRHDELARLLRSVLAQSREPDEILVVDNDPDDSATRQIVERAGLRARYIEENRRGLNRCRQRALTESSGDIVLYLDDDTVADAGWSTAISEPFLSDPALGVCTARVEALEVATPAQVLFEANGGFSRGRVPVVLGRDADRAALRPRIAAAISAGCGASFAVRRAAAQAVGGFDPRLDRGGELPGGGDLDMFWRLIRAGYALRYEPEALVWHDHRRELRLVADQLAGHQRGLLAFLVKSLLSVRAREKPGVLAFIAWRLVKPLVRIVRRMLGLDPLPVPILLSMWRNCWLGLIAYFKPL